MVVHNQKLQEKPPGRWNQHYPSYNLTWFHWKILHGYHWNFDFLSIFLRFRLNSWNSKAHNRKSANLAPWPSLTFSGRMGRKRDFRGLQCGQRALEVSNVEFWSVWEFPKLGSSCAKAQDVHGQGRINHILGTRIRPFGSILHEPFKWMPNGSWRHINEANQGISMEYQWYIQGMAVYSRYYFLGTNWKEWELLAIVFTRLLHQKTCILESTKRLCVHNIPFPFFPPFQLFPTFGTSHLSRCQCFDFSPEAARAYEWSNHETFESFRKKKPGKQVHS